MSGIDNTTVNRIANAEDRLARAIGRLEAALETQAASAKPIDANLAQELSRLQTENGELRALVGTASARLDDTIVRLKTKLALG